MLPDIDYTGLQNIKKDSIGESENPCLLCKKQITGKCEYVLLEEGLGFIVDPNTPEPNGGWHPIGPGCAKKHPELKKYFARVEKRTV